MIAPDQDLDALFKRLHLANARRVWRDLVQRAERESWSYRDFLMLLVKAQLSVVQLRQGLGSLLATDGIGHILRQSSATGNPLSSVVKFGTTHLTTRKWRNWQTHQLEGLAVAIPWGFESPLPHQLATATRRAGPRARPLGRP